MNWPYELQIGWRYTRAGRVGRRNRFISFISAVSMLGIALGVAALIIVLSVMNGFRKEVRDRMLSVVSHVEVGASLLALWGLPAAVIEAVAAHTAVPPPTAPTDPSSAVALAHLIVEAELGPVCGPYGSTPFAESALDEPAREVVSRWRSARSRQASPAPPAP